MAKGRRPPSEAAMDTTDRLGHDRQRVDIGLDVIPLVGFRPAAADDAIGAGREEVGLRAVVIKNSICSNPSGVTSVFTSSAGR